METQDARIIREYLGDRSGDCVGRRGGFGNQGSPGTRLIVKPEVWRHWGVRLMDVNAQAILKESFSSDAIL